MSAIPIPSQAESLEESERQAVEVLRPELEKHLSLVRDYINLIGNAAVSIPPQPLTNIPKALVVSSLLLARLSNDLRCLLLVAERGYPLQALTLAASIYEIGITIASIGGDNVQAQKWFEHDKPERPFLKNLHKATREVFKNCGIPEFEVQAQGDYRVYQQFCMGKHGNPLLQSGHGIVPAGKDVNVRSGPDTSELAVNNLWYAMAYSARYSYISVYAFTTYHVPTAQQDYIQKLADVLGARREQLQAIARKRWGTTDPFQGLWRNHTAGG